MKKELPFMQFLKNIRPLDLMYPGILILFFIIVLGIFFFTIRFISRNINEALSSESTDTSQALNDERYQLATKKLNIATLVHQDKTITPEISTSTTAVVPLDKQSITIMVKNSTSKKGVASIIARILEDNGFKKPQTGNESKLYATTTIILKESKRDYSLLLLEALKESYPEATTTTAETGDFDAIVIIGTN